MPKWTEGDLRTQYLRAKNSGWIPWFLEGARLHDLDPGDGMGIASRETNMQNKRGDYHESRYFPKGGYHGYGVMQVDIGTAPDWIRSGAWQDPHQAILKGYEILASKRDAVEAKLSDASPGDRRKVYLALYNGGHAIQMYQEGRDPSAETTGHDYGTDVDLRSVHFRKWLLDDGFLNHPDSEVAEDSQLDGPPAQEPKPAGNIYSSQSSQEDGASKSRAESEALPAKPVSAPSDIPIPVTTGSLKSMVGGAMTFATGSGAGLIGFLKGDHTLLYLAVGLIGLVALILGVRWVVLDIIRMKYAADPNKYNVK